MPREKYLPKDDTEAFMELWKYAETGRLQSATMGSGSYAHNPYHRYGRNLVKQLAVFRDIIKPVLEESDKPDGMSLYDILSNRGDEHRWLNGVTLGEALEQARKANLVTNSATADQSSAYVLAYHGVRFDTEPIYLDAKDQAVGCIGSLTVGATTFAIINGATHDPLFSAWATAGALGAGGLFSRAGSDILHAIRAQQYYTQLQN